MHGKRQYNRIPLALSMDEFEQFVLPHLLKGSRGPEKKISFFKIFNYILKLMYTGCQWSELPIQNDATGKPELSYTRIFRAFQFWSQNGCFDNIFTATVLKLFKAKMLDTSVIHGDGTCTVAKKGVII